MYEPVQKMYARIVCLEGAVLLRCLHVCAVITSIVINEATKYASETLRTRS